ncbi:hypothetical protein TNCV_4429851 [Trichonephila clavipes]|nr:hypothetical protein TNCV_4429851 [Trichonephila clavipes]
MPGENFWRRPGLTQSCRVIEEEELFYCRSHGDTEEETIRKIRQVFSNDGKLLVSSLPFFTSDSKIPAKHSISEVFKPPYSPDMAPCDF